jgi:hypothetical protein
MDFNIVYTCNLKKDGTGHEARIKQRRNAY